MMGDLDISAFSVFAEAGRQAFSSNISFWEITKAILVFLELLMKDWGLAMALGCIPWLVGCGWISYRLTKKWLIRRQEGKLKAKERRAYWHALLHKEKESGNSKEFV